MAHILTIPAQISPAPTIEPETRLPQDYQTIQTNPRQFGAALAQGEESLGEHLSAAGKIFGQIAADQATNNYETETTKLLFGDPDVPGDQGFYGLRGQDAMDAMPAVRQKLLSLRQQIATSLTTSDQQLLFDQQTRRQHFMLLSEIGRHYDQQAQAWGASVNRAAFDNRIQSIASRPDDDQNFDMSVADAMSAKLKTLQLSGQANNPEAVQHALTEARQAAVAARVEALLPNNPAKAKAFLDANADVMRGPLYDSLSSKLRARSTAALGNQLASDAQSGDRLSVGGAVPGAISGSDPRGMEPLIRQAAIRYGHDPDVAVRVARSEGLGTFLGDSGTSGGSFQLHVGGGLGDEFRRDTGLDPLDPTNEPATIDYAMRRLGETGWTPYHGAARVGVGNRQGVNIAIPQDEVMAQSTVPTGVRTAGNATLPPGNPAPGVEQIAAAQQENAVGLARALARLSADPRAADNPEAAAAAERKLRADYAVKELTLTGQMKAITDQRNLALDEYVKELAPGKPITPDLIDRVTSDGRLDATSRENIYRLINEHAKKSIDGDIAKYGNGFFDAYRRMILPDNDPNKLRDPSQILAMAVPKADGTQDLTIAGVDKLNAELRARQNPEKVGEAKIREGALAYAHKKLTVEMDLGMGTKLRFPAGEDAFNTGFLPAFFKYWDDGIAAGKSMQELAKKENLDALIQPFDRPESEKLKWQLGNDQKTPAEAIDLKSQTGIVAAYRAGKITRDEASKALIDNGFAVAPTPIAPPPAAPARPEAPLAR